MRIIAGLLKGRLLKGPKSAARPSSEKLRGSVFNICQDIQGLLVLDLFAGSGAMGFEALSRGARHVTFVDNDKGSLSAIYANSTALGVNNQVTILPYKAERALKTVGLFDIIFLDPPYSLSAHPFIAGCKEHLKPLGNLFVEDRHGCEVFQEPLELITTRRFGDSRLRHFILSC